MSVTIEYAIFKLHEAGKDICIGCKFFNWKSDTCEKLPGQYELRCNGDK